MPFVFISCHFIISLCHAEVKQGAKVAAKAYPTLTSEDPPPKLLIKASKQSKRTEPEPEPEIVVVSFVTNFLRILTINVKIIMKVENTQLQNIKSWTFYFYVVKLL